MPATHGLSYMPQDAAAERDALALQLQVRACVRACACECACVRSRVRACVRAFTCCPRLLPIIFTPLTHPQQMTRMRDAAVQLLTATSSSRDSLARHNHLLVLELEEARARVRVLQVPVHSP